MPPRDEPEAPPEGGAAPAAKLLSGLMAAAALALGGWVAWEATRDGPVEPEEAEPGPALPEPGEPRVRPMVGSDSGFGWTWVNPRPRGMPTWYAVDRAPRGDRVVMVGRAGAAIRYAEGALYAWSTGTERTLRGVAWVGAREAVAAGEGATLVRLGPDGPSALDVPDEARAGGPTLRAVAATGEGRALVVGDGGTALRVGPDGVEAVDLGTDADLLAVHARGDDVFVAGTGGTVLRLAGEPPEVRVEEPGVEGTLRAIGGCARGSLYAAGDDGVLLRRRPSGAWRRVRAGRGEAFTAVACDHGRVAAVAADGRVVLVSGARTVELPSGFERAWHGVDGGADGPSWLVGVGGRLATIERDHVRIRTAGPTVPIRDLGGMGGALVAVGEWGRILRQREGIVARVESPTEAGLAALVQVNEGRLLAVGDFGAMVDIRFDRATLLEAPTEASLRDGVSDGEALLVVGAGGTVLRGRIGAPRASVVPDVGDLWSVAGTPSEAVAVGDEGVVLRLSPTGFSRVPCETEATLRAVARTDAGTWAVGDDGRIVRVEADGCAIEHEGGPTLHAVGVGPHGRMLAAGDEGTVLERGEDGTWGPAGVEVGRASLRAIWRGRRYVYVAGTGGVLVRHILVDAP